MKVLRGIYPKIDVAEIRRIHPERNPEMDVYEGLAQELSTQFLVLYNCNWHDASPKKRLNRDGEADFVVAHPDIGFICLEVKGGDVYRDEMTRGWWRRVSSGRKAIKDPVEQARRSKHVIFDLLQEQWRGSLPVIRIKHGVILPNSGRPKGGERLGGDMPLDIFAFYEDMDHIGGRVIEILMKEPNGTKPGYGKLGDKGVQIIFDLFQRALNFPVSLKSELDHYDRRLDSLTDEQNEILEITDGQRRLLVMGGAGSGKTFLALKKAEQFAAAGLSTLFLVFNTALAEHLRCSAAPSAKLRITPFHEFCGWICAQAGIEMSAEGISQEDFYSVLLPTALLKALEKREDIRFDALVVDEAQDFRSAWWDPALLALRDFEKARICVFLDDNQNIYGGEDSVARILGVQPHFLTKNVRNTQSIFRTALPFYEGHTKRSVAPQGPSVRFLAKAVAQQTDAVRDELLRLLNVEGVGPDQIAILSMCALKKSAIKADATANFAAVLADDKRAAKMLVRDSLWRFKGLERRIVILTDIEKSVDNRELLYVGFSRARTLLIVVADQVAVSRLQSLITARS